MSNFCIHGADWVFTHPESGSWCVACLTKQNGEVSAALAERDAECERLRGYERNFCELMAMLDRDGGHAQTGNPGQDKERGMDAYYTLRTELTEARGEVERLSTRVKWFEKVGVDPYYAYFRMEKERDAATRRAEETEERLRLAVVELREIVLLDSGDEIKAFILSHGFDEALKRIFSAEQWDELRRARAREGENGPK